MNVDKPIDDGLSVGGGLGKVRVHHGEVVGTDVLHNRENIITWYVSKYSRLHM